MDAKIAEIDELIKRNLELEVKAKSSEAADTILRDMIEKGEAYMDENGNVSVV
jgi:hypothetical protein